jgi:uncharacterized protein (DUF111 family)
MSTNSTSNEEGGFSPKMALCLAAITMVGIDLEFKEEELEKLRKLVLADETAFLKAFSFYNEHSLDICMKIVSEKLTDKQKQVAYMIMYDLAKADYEFAGAEENLLKKYAADFRLSSEFVDSMNTFEDHQYDLTLFE